MKSALKVNVDHVLRTFQARGNQYPQRAEVQVGFSAPHALRVHEDLQARHDNGQAKFLETPFRQLRLAIFRIVEDYLVMKRPLLSALMRAGRVLLAAAKAIVPVRTGELKNSGYCVRKGLV